MKVLQMTFKIAGRAQRNPYVPRYNIFGKNKEDATKEGTKEQEQEINKQEFLTNKITQLETQLQEKDELVKDQQVQIKQLDESNRDHILKLKDLRETVKAQIEEQELLVKRVNKEKEGMKIYAIQNFAKDLLDVQDNLERALESSKEAIDEKNLLEGVVLTHKILEKTLHKYGVNKMLCVGKPFDPNQHESLFEVEDATKDPGTVVFVAQDGYTMADRVLRPAKVGFVKQK
ncbi:hypothetical protein pb186bvf_006216 [Paramecium bursaria]